MFEIMNEGSEFVFTLVNRLFIFEKRNKNATTRLDNH